ncbi:FG-GAP repeat domain-containing protein [Maritalea mediterranea]|uniref:VCBS repeat-containing protein n=1 Tax=Maritalea mediterranea TaxID=2909667 RepID=A0ABS9E4K6_9HYPH|nr:VCBS repeat-containing protein [Maritalea mediterranea]MCF4097723.1 VCBS repeat-containing protein [Maritalea mediterranea]
MRPFHCFALNFTLVALSFVLAIPTAWAQILPHSHTATGTNLVQSVELIGPTQRYQHFVLSDQFEAAGFRVTYRDGTQSDFTLPATEVFEDRVPRLVDLTGDGHEELILVQSHIQKGASLAIYDLAPGNINLRAQTPYIGQPNRWLNPAGIADFDGDGHMEIALVSKPHLAKELQLWRFTKGQLSLVSTHVGFSNHRLGSREQQLSAQADMNADGITDLIVPGPNRKSLHMISFANGFEVLRTIELAGEIAGPVTLNGSELRVPLRAGRAEIFQIF